MATGLQRGAKRSVIVNLAVEDDEDAAVLVGDRLPARGAEIDDAEPPVREAEVTVDDVAGVVRAADAHHVAEDEQRRLVDRRPSPRPDAGDPAHRYATSAGR